MRPAEVLDCQRDLIERCEGSRAFRTMIASLYVSSVAGMTLEPAEQQARRRAAEPIVDILAMQARTAYAYRVTTDMCVVLQHAAEGLNDEDVFDRDLLPSEAGFCRFDKPIEMRDVHGKIMLIHWLVWGPGQGGVVMWFFNDPLSQADQYQTEYLHKVGQDNPDLVDKIEYITGRFATVGFDIATTGHRLGPARLTEEDHGDYEIPLDLQAYKDGKIPSESVNYAVTNLIRYVHALFLMFSQTITTIDTEEPDRAGVRRARRMKIPPQVTVIRLRRTESNARLEGESLVEWYHRWVVRRHPAWRKCGQDHPGAQPYAKGWRVRVWIESYVKNADRVDLPLIVTDKLYSLDR